MTPKQRRFLVINYWVGTPASGALVGPVLVSTSDYRHFHFWDELEAAILESGDYQIVKVYPLGSSFNEAQVRYVQEFQSKQTVEDKLPNPIAAVLRWGGVGQQAGQPCITA